MIKKYKYLYKIEYLNSKEGQARYYIGSRTSNLKPEEDLFKKYFTSSKTINQIIKDEGINVFNIVWLKEIDTLSIFHEEAKVLSEIDAKNHPEYFNEHNNEGYLDLASINIICPHCKKKNYDSLFNLCSYCQKVMIKFKCHKCSNSKNTNERCSSCGYSKIDDKTIDKIVNLRKSGYSFSKISNIDSRILSKIFTDRGYSHKQNLDIGMVCQKYLEYQSIYKVAKEYGCNPSTIYRIVSSRNLIRKNFFSAKEEEYIVQEFISTKKTVTDLAIEFNCSTSPISRVLNKNNIKIYNKKRNKQLTKAEISQIIREYDECKNITFLSKKYNQTTNAISKILKSYDIEIINTYSIPKLSESCWGDILNMYSNGDSIAKIAKHYEVGTSCIKRILKKNNVNIINRQNVAKMNESVFEVIDSEEKAYWLGFIYADGYISNGEFGVHLSIKDEEHIKKLKSFLEFTGNIRYKKSTQSCGIAFRNKKIIGDLKKLGVVERKSKVLTFPTEAQVPQYLIRHFIRGYVDGDGYVGFNKNGLCRLSILGTESMLDGIIKAMGFKKLKIRKANKNGCDEVKEIEWGGLYVFDYLSQLYNDSTIFLDRKQSKIKESINVRNEFLNISEQTKNSTLPRRRAVNQYSSDGVLINQWDSVESASASLNIRTDSIMRVCRGDRRFYAGYKWQYVS